MTPGRSRYVYGPVPSRRLGHSLGIDLVPFKTCTYDCVYCQLGRTTNKTLERKEYVAVDGVLAELERKLAEKNAPDYISLAGSGEPTLNSAIGRLISGIKRLTDIPVAVLTNGSLLWMKDVQDDLMAADLVLPSLDAGDEARFHYVNRPHKDISFDQMVDGLITFTARFRGNVWLEVFLLEGITGTPEEIAAMAAIIRQINPARVQLNTVSRPPAEEFARPVPADRLPVLADLFPGPVDIISESVRNETRAAVPGHTAAADILALLNRRPCTATDVADGLGLHVAEALKRLETLVATGTVERTAVAGRLFYHMMPNRKKPGHHAPIHSIGEMDRYLRACQTEFWERVFRVELEIIIEYVHGAEDILSVGCGPAVIEGRMAERGFHVTGLDISPQALALAPHGVKTVAASADRMPFPASSFDVVMFIASLQFMDDYGKALAEATRVLRPKGTLLILLLNTESAFIKDKLRDPDSYMSKIRHTDVREIETAAAKQYHLHGEYALGVKDGSLFASRDAAEAALYVIHGTPKPMSRDGRS